MRIGSMTTKHIRFLMSDGRDGRCAIGACLDAVNIKILNRFEDIRMAEARFPILNALVVHPDGPYRVSLEQVIFYLNDGGNKTREEIADYIETIENEEEMKTKTTDKVLQEIK